MPKKKGISYWDKKAWKEFSIFIRTRDCLKTTGTKTHGKCFTCDIVLPFKKLQAGHYIPRQMKNVRYDERNVNAQCYACNMMYSGLIAEYGERLDSKVKEDLIQKQREYRAGNAVKLDSDYYEELYDKYKEKNKEFEESINDFSVDDLPF